MDRAMLEQAIFYEAAYFAKHPDAKRAVDQQQFSSGRDHWDRTGRRLGYEATWVVPAALDADAYFLHYPQARETVEAGADPEVDSAAAHFRRYGNRQGLFYFEKKTVTEIVERPVERIVTRHTSQQTPKLSVNGKRLEVVILTPCLSVGGMETWMRSLATKTNRQHFRFTILLNQQAKQIAEQTAKPILKARGRIIGTLNDPLVEKHATFLEAAHAALDNADLLMVWGSAHTLGPVFEFWKGPTISEVQSVCWGTRNVAAYLALFGAKYTVAASEYAAAVLPQTADIKVIWNGIDLNRCKPRTAAFGVKTGLWNFQPVGERGLRERFVGFLGRLSWEKHPIAAAQAVSQLPWYFKCVMVGSGGSQDEVLAEAERLVGKERLVHVPACENIADHLNAMDVLVHASPEEGFGLVPVEAMAVGVPVVATRVGVIPELERRFGQVVYPLPRNPTAHEIATTVREAIDAGRDAEIVVRARQVVREHLTEERMIDEWERHIVHVVEADKRPKPKVSVVVPAWNEERRIEKALRAIQSQTFEDYEVIIVDDCSQDGTVAVVESFIDGWGKARLIRRETNGGTGAALNSGFKVVRGGYCTWWSADSWPDPEWLESLVKALDENPNAGLAYSDWLFLSGGKIIHQKVRENAHEDIIEGDNLGPCWLFRTRVKDAAGEYLSIPSEDRDMHCRMAAVAPFVHIPRMLGTWKSHNDNVTNRLITPAHGGQSLQIRATHRLRKVQRES